MITKAPFALLVVIGAFVLCGQTKDAAPRNLAPVAFANLGTPADGTILYCTDCRSTNPATAGGTGFEARMLNGIWDATAAPPLQSTNGYAACCSNVPFNDWHMTTTGRRATPNFSTESATAINYKALFGQNDETNEAKRTFVTQEVGLSAPASGQRFLRAGGIVMGGLGDAIIDVVTLNVFGSSNSGGDEGQYLYRGVVYNGDGGPITGTIGVSSQTTCNTTTTQAITKIVDPDVGQTASSVTVASTTGCVVGNWVTIQSNTTHGITENEEAVQITAVGGGAISAVFLKDHPSGVTVNFAVAVPPSSGVFNSNFAQDRLLVNLTQMVTGPGTVSAGGSGSLTITGSGTNFSNSMVGGTATNPGCNALNADTASGIKSWFPIDVIASTTSLTVYSQLGSRITSAAGSTYFVAPCARIRNFVFNALNPASASSVVLSYNPFTWTSGNSVEVATAPDADISGIILRMYPTLPHARWNSPFIVDNLGGRDIYNAGYMVRGSISAGFSQGFIAKNSNTGFQVISDGVHTGNSLGIATAAGDPRAINWSGALTAGSAFDWKIGPDDATGNFQLKDAYAASQPLWTAYQRTATTDLRFSINGKAKALGYQSSDGSDGATATIVVKGSDGNNCNIVYKNGLYVSTTCP